MTFSSDASSDPQPGSGDPTEVNYWGELIELQRELDEDLARVYRERGMGELSTRFAYPLIRLAHRGPMTIRQLAQSMKRTHSALSQTVKAMRDQGLVEAIPGADARTRVIHLTDKAREVLPFLEAEWRATERASAQLDSELQAPLAEYVRQVRARVEERSFAQRIIDVLEAPQTSGTREAENRPDPA